jgi:hypothetical protein
VALAADAIASELAGARMEELAAFTDCLGDS